MIFREPTYQSIRQGTPEDSIGILEILAANYFYLPLSEISKKIANFFVFDIDEVVYGCVLAEKCSIDTLEASYLLAYADEEEYIEQKLLESLIDNGKRLNSKHIFLEANKNPVWLGLYPWFLNLGFQKYHSKDLPWTKKNHTAEVWVKTL